MYDLPKAAHFVARSTVTGEILPPLDPAGFSARWMAAGLVQLEGVANMIRLSERGQEKVRRAIAAANETLAANGVAVRIELDTTMEEKCKPNE